MRYIDPSSRRGIPVKQLSCLMLCLAAGAAPAQTTYKYSVLFQNEVRGAQTTVVAPDGRITVDFSYRDNGRGPDAREAIVLAKDGTQLSHRVTGKSTFGAPMDEGYAREGATARWYSNAGRGEAPVAGAVAYFPVSEASPQADALLARALALRPDRRLALLPAGEIRLARLREARLESGGQKRKVALYAITGIDYAPTYVWLEEPGLRLFASIYPGWAQVIEAGWEAQAPRLEHEQIEAQAGQLAAMAPKLAHRPDGLLVIRNARVFDSEHARLGPPADVYVNHGRIAGIYEAGS